MMEALLVARGTTSDPVWLRTGPDPARRRIPRARLARAVLGASLVASGAAVHPLAAADFTAVDAVFADYDRSDAPGCAVGIVRDGALVHARGYGMANLEHAIPIDARSVFRTGSVSKQFTAMAVVLAARAGRLSLDDDLRRWLPELHDYGTPVTLRQMLRHTSGLRDYLVLMELAGKRDEDFYTDAELVAALARLEKLNFPPGDDYAYSNSGYFLLSQVVGRATGQSLAAWARQRIFTPLGMADTHFHDDFRRIVPRRASGYRPLKDGGFEIDQTTLNMVGDGGVFTTIEDFAKWDRNFDAPAVGDASVLEELQRPGVLNDGTPQEYALGLRVAHYCGQRLVEHGGAFVGFRAAYVRFPDARLSLVALCNRADAQPTTRLLRVADALLEGQLAPAEAQPPALPEAERARRLGTYWNPEIATFVDVKETDGRLQLEADGSPYRLRPAGSGRFRAIEDEGEASVRFVPESGPAERLELDRSGMKPRSYRRVAGAAPGDLGPLVGEYRCGELAAVARLGRNAEGKLVLHVPPALEAELTSLDADLFRWSGGSLVVVRDAAGGVAGFDLSAFRARGFRFARQP